MKRLHSFCTLILSAMAIVWPAYDLSATPLSKQDLHAYYRNLKNAIAYQELCVQHHLEEVNKKGSSPTEEQKLALQNATQMLEVKQALMQTFDDVVHLQNAHVRDLLLAIMQKSTISGNDLLELGLAIRKTRQQ